VTESMPRTNPVDTGRHFQQPIRRWETLAVGSPLTGRVQGRACGRRSDRDRLGPDGRLSSRNPCASWIARFCACSFRELQANHALTPSVVEECAAQ